MKRYSAPPLSPPQVSLGYIPKGYLGTKRTVEHMGALIRAGVRDFYVRQKAIDIVLEKKVRPKDYLGEIRALFEWVQRNVRYTKDPFRLEVLHSARRMLELRAGDCDDLAILLGAMLESIGHPVRLVLAGPDPLRPLLFTHVYLEARHRDRWIPLDPTMPYPMGWSPRTVVKQVIAMDRSPHVMAHGMERQGMIGASDALDWQQGLLRAVRREAMQPKDARVKLLWNLLRHRHVLGRSRWLTRVLCRIWDQGLTARPRPRTTRRMARLLRQWGILPPRTTPPSGPSISISLQPATSLIQLRPVLVPLFRPRRPIVAPPGRSVSVPPVAASARRR
jgi:hypothetical protein